MGVPDDDSGTAWRVRRLVQDNAIGEPSGRRLGEGLVRDHNGEIFASSNGDVLNGAQIDVRMVGLFLYFDSGRHLSGWRRSGVGDGHNTEVVLFAFRQTGHRVTCLGNQNRIGFFPFGGDFQFLLDDVAFDAQTSFARRWVPRQSDAVPGNPIN